LVEGSQAMYNDIYITYILYMDPQKDGVVRLKGDTMKLDTIIDNVYVGVI